MGLNVAQGSENNGGAFTSHGGCVCRQKTGKLGGILFVKVLGTGLLTWYCVFTLKSGKFVMFYLDVFHFLSVVGGHGSKGRLSLWVISISTSQSLYHL